MPRAVVIGSEVSSWLAASISTDIEMFSIGAPLNRRASLRAPVDTVLLPVAARACRVRVISSGLYWNATTLASGLAGSRPTSAPRRVRGDDVRPVIGARSGSDPCRHTAAGVSPARHAGTRANGLWRPAPADLVTPRPGGLP